MTANQNDNRNQQSDSKSHQQRTQDGKKKEETNPNIPKANKDDHQGNKQNQNFPGVKAETNTSVQDEMKKTNEPESEKTGR